MASQATFEKMVKYCFLSKYEKKYGTLFLKDCIGEKSSELTVDSVKIIVKVNITEEDIRAYRDGKL